MGFFGPPSVEKMEAKRDVKGLIKALKDEDKHVRRRATEALGNIGDAKAVEPFIEALKDEDEDVRKRAIEFLGIIRDARAVEPLIEVMNDKDEDVQIKARVALVSIEEPALEPLIQSLLHNKSTMVRDNATWALGEIGGARAVEPLIEVMNDKDEDKGVRQVAAAAVGDVGGAEVVEPLIEVMNDKDEDEDVREGAMRALRDIGTAGGTVEPLFQPLMDKIISGLLEALKDKNKLVRQAAREALDRLR